MGPSMFVDGDLEVSDPGRAITADASMGPSMFVDGDTTGMFDALVCLGASMGPSMFVDGDPVGVTAMSAASWMLQWGRRCSSTETLATVAKNA